MTLHLAIALLWAATASDAPAGLARLAEARALLAAKHPEDAARMFETANRDAAGRCAECLVGAAEAWLAASDYGVARKAAARAASLPDCTPALRAHAYVLVGFSRFREAPGDERALRSAVEAFRSALQASPEDVTARTNLGLALLKLSRDAEAVAELRAVLERAPDVAGADRLRELIANPRRARDTFAPDFRVRTLQGEDVTLASLRGRAVVLDFWGTWCGPCVASVPELKDLVRRYGQRVTLLSVSVNDGEDTWRSFVASHDMTWPQYRDADGTLAKRFGVNAFPTYLLLDGEGAIVETIKGFDDQRSVGYRLRRSLDQLLPPPR